MQSPLWALIPALSIVVVIGAVEVVPNSADGLTYLALIAVPPLAFYAIANLIHHPRPLTSSFVPVSGTKDEVSGLVASVVVVGVLLGLAWGEPGRIVGEAAATALTGLACVTLGWLLVSAVPARWVRLGVYAMALVDTIYVSADILQAPNAVLNAAAPAAGLPALQAVHLGSAAMGFGDLFVAALVGCLLALPADGPIRQATLDVSARRRRVAVGLVVGLALVFDLLFLAVDELPATVPVAVALALVSWRGGQL